MRVKINENERPEGEFMHRERDDFVRAAKQAEIALSPAPDVVEQQQAVQIAENRGKQDARRRERIAPRQVVQQAERLQRDERRKKREGEIIGDLRRDIGQFGEHCREKMADVIIIQRMAGHPRINGRKRL